MDTATTPPIAPPLEAILPDLGALMREKVIIDDHTLVLERPDKADDLLDHPAVRSAFQADEYMPYWTDIWPASRMLAKVLLRNQWPAGTLALEVGCGLGLPGIAALAKGLRVIFSDYDATALSFAANNARLNGFHDFETLQLDWRYPPADLRVPLLLAADLIYEMRNIRPLVLLIKQLLAPTGECLLTDQDRVPAQALRDTLREEGLPFTTEIVRAGEPGGRRFKGTLYRIRLPAPPGA